MGTIPLSFKQLWISKKYVFTVALLWAVYMFSNPGVAFRKQLSGLKPGCLPLSRGWDIALKVSSASSVVCAVV